jgi:hypothetical protein
MMRAHEHQVRHFLGQFGRECFVATRAVIGVCNDMREESKHWVFATRQEISDQMLIAAPELASAASFCPQGSLGFLGYPGLGH